MSDNHRCECDSHCFKKFVAPVFDREKLYIGGVNYPVKVFYAFLCTVINPCDVAGCSIIVVVGIVACKRKVFTVNGSVLNYGTEKGS